MKKTTIFLLMALFLATIAYAVEQEVIQIPDVAVEEPSSTAKVVEQEATQEPDAELDAEAIDFLTEAGGYTGEQVEVDELNIVFCLPDGWRIEETTDDVVLYAINSDNTAELFIYLEAKDVVDLNAWAEENLDQYEVGVTNLHDVLIQVDGSNAYIQFINSENQLITFQFKYDSADALSREFALEIVGSAHDLWFGEGAQDVEPEIPVK